MDMDSLQKDKAHANQHWEAKYEGTDETVACARSKYESSVGLSKEYLPAAVTYLSTLISAVNSNLAQVAFGKVWRLGVVASLWIDLKILLAKILDEHDFQKKLSPTEKDVVMTALLMTRQNQKLSIALGCSILNAGESASATIKLLATAKLSRIKMLSKSRQIDYHERVMEAIHDKSLQKTLGWKTVNRLARLVGDEDMVWHSAKKDGSRDLRLKSLGWQVAHMFYLV
jgi:hypothetical protein